MEVRSMNNDEMKNIPETRYTAPSKGESWFVSFFKFRKMVAFGLLRVIYALGVIVFLFASFPISRDVLGSYGYYIIVMPIIQILWRLLCEFLVLLFSIQDIVASIERKLSNK